MSEIIREKKALWPFDQAKNCAVFTIRQILEGKCPIEIVFHDLEDGGWQFLSHIDYTMDDAKLVALGEMVKRDPSVLDIATMKPGYHAWRNNVGDPWIIEKTPNEDEA